MNNKSAEEALKYLYNLSNDSGKQAHEVHGTMLALCVWAQSHKATKGDMVKLLSHSWDSVDEFKNVTRLKKQAKDLGFDL